MARTKPVKLPKNPLQRVLLAEDDPILALELEAALIDGGVGEVTICATMAAAVAALNKSRPDAIILDVHLADRDDGWAIAEVVSLLGPKRPRIAFSTASPQDIPAAIKELGPVFEKPYDPAHLVKVLMSGNKTGLIARLRGALS